MAPPQTKERQTEGKIEYLVVWMGYMLVYSIWVSSMTLCEGSASLSYPISISLYLCLSLPLSASIYLSVFLFEL